MVQSWTSPLAKSWDPSHTAMPWSTPVADISDPSVRSGPQNTPTPDIPTPWNLPHRDAMKYQYQTMTDSLRSWVKPLGGITGLHTPPLGNAGGSHVLFSSDIGRSKVHSEINTVQSQVQSSKAPFRGQRLARPWLEITPGVGPWTHFVPDKTGIVMQIQSSEESVRTQIHHVADRVDAVVKPVTYNLQPWVPLIVNKIGFWAHSILYEERSQYPMVTDTLEPWFQPVLNIVRSQGPIEKTEEYRLLPESKSTQFWTASTLNRNFT